MQDILELLKDRTIDDFWTQDALNTIFSKLERGENIPETRNSSLSLFRSYLFRLRPEVDALQARIRQQAGELHQQQLERQAVEDPESASSDNDTSETGDEDDEVLELEEVVGSDDELDQDENRQGASPSRPAPASSDQVQVRQSRPRLRFPQQQQQQ